MPAVCPDCGALHSGAQTCQEDFYTLLGWENEYPGYGEVHHLLVLCYHLQHPGLYSPEGLAYAKGLLLDFLVHGKTTEDFRRANRSRVSSTNREWKIKGKAGSRGSHEGPVQWSMNAADITADDHTCYRENVRRWATSILESLHLLDNL